MRGLGEDGDGNVGYVQRSWSPSEQPPIALTASINQPASTIKLKFERYHSPSTLPLKTTRNRFPLASVCSVVPTFPASVCSVCSVVPWFSATRAINTAMGSKMQMALATPPRKCSTGL